MQPVVPPPPTPFTLTIATSLYAPNVRQLAINAGWNGADPLIVNITAALIGALDFGALDFGATSYPKLTVNISAATRIAGVPGGVALTTRTFLTLNNAGTISGGGGAGGRGVSVTSFRVANTTKGGAAGGGGGNGQGVVNASGTAVAQGTTAGNAGTRVDISDPSTGLSGWARGGNGGRGGEWGQSGNPGDSYTKSGNASINTLYSPEVNRAPGAAVDGDSYITWAALGTLHGTRIN